MFEHDKKAAASNRKIYYQNGRIYFDKSFERSIYFVLTISVLIMGALVKIGII